MLQVSVIIPTYNRAEYLSLALKSVFSQSFSPFEIIVVDDGSSDNTADVVRAFGPKVRYFQQDHQGVSAARNLGLEVAQGEVIAWLDADDLWESDFLASVVSRLEAAPELDGVYTGFDFIDAVGHPLLRTCQKVVRPDDLFSELVSDNFVQTSTIVVRKRCFDQVGNFDLQFRICEDYDMFLRLAKTCTVVGIPTLLARYRVHGNNTVKDTDVFAQSRLAVVGKYFGAQQGDPLAWPADKRRAYAYAFRFIAVKYFQAGQPDQGEHYFEQAVSIWPGLLCQLDTVYELVCGDQPTGQRGRADLLDIDGNGLEVLRRLDRLFARRGAELESVRRTAYGNVYLALSILSDKAGRWVNARRYLFQAVSTCPRLLTSCAVARRLVKLCAGKRLVRLAREILDGTQ